MRGFVYRIHVIFLFLAGFTSFTYSQQNESNNEIIAKIDSIIISGINNDAYPGAVVYVLHRDSVLLHKAYGYHTYDSVRRMLAHHIFDLASVTKVTAATLSMMMLYDRGLVDIDGEVRDYIDWIGNKRGKSSIRETLAHQAGWRPWIPYYQKMMKNGEYRKRFFRTDSSDRYPVKVKEGLYLTSRYYRYIQKQIRRSDFDPDRGYAYSGLFFYMIPEIVKKQAGLEFDDFLDTHFYNVVGAGTTSFRPLERFPDSLIVPTEVDTFFRMEPIHGTVHDEGAIVMGGISGNAGLFSNAEDLAKIWKVFLNDGRHDSVQLIKPSTLELFTTAQYPGNDNRRGLGFDKPLLEYDSTESSVAKDASFRSYGHSGYTGPLVWADPDHDVLFIFLCNRVYPSRLRRQIYELGIRPKVHQQIYNLIKYSEGDDRVDDGHPRKM